MTPSSTSPQRAKVETLVEPESNEFRLALPGARGRLEQDCEWCVVELDDGWEEIRFHDYHRIYEIPGLYEHLFRDVLQCRSPETVVGLLAEVLAARDGGAPPSLRVLDLGAGNGMVGEQLRAIGAEPLIGVDILAVAKRAAERDRPGLYQRYYATDMTRLAPALRQEMAAHSFDALTCVAALGFGDIPPRAFAEAFNLIRDGGAIAFNVREKFLQKGDGSGFARLIRSMTEDGVLSLRADRRYVHRLAANGDPIHYVAIVGEKRRPVRVPA